MPATGRFDLKPNSQKVQCRICGRSGYMGGSWMNACRKPHDFACDDCPKAYPSKQALAAHRRKAHHD